MKTITVINAKGGCGKSTTAMSLAAGLARKGQRVLIMDLDPQAQITHWLGVGDGLSNEGSLVAAFAGKQTLSALIRPTAHTGIHAVAAASGLEDMGREISREEGYPAMLADLLEREKIAERFDFLILDSPNQISPIMENAIFPADLFVVPFESTKAVKSYASIYKLLLRHRPAEDYMLLPLLTNLSKWPGLRRKVLALMAYDGILPARTEIRSCGWLAQVDEYGGDIFSFRPHSRGAEDMSQLTEEVMALFTNGPTAAQPEAPSAAA